jgi:hypothetical protein
MNNSETARPRSSLLRWILLIVVVALPASCVYMEVTARGKADAFCSGAVVGATLQPLTQEAQNTGEKILRHISTENVSVGFVGIPPFSRYICTINAQDGKITGATVSHID